MLSTLPGTARPPSPPDPQPGSRPHSPGLSGEGGCAAPPHCPQIVGRLYLLEAESSCEGQGWPQSQKNCWGVPRWSLVKERNTITLRLSQGGAPEGPSRARWQRRPGRPPSCPSPGGGLAFRSHTIPLPTCQDDRASAGTLGKVPLGPPSPHRSPKAANPGTSTSVPCPGTQPLTGCFSQAPTVT